MSEEEEKKLKNKISVTDHAVLRYTQRVIGINTDYVKESIRNDEHQLIRYLQKIGLISINKIKEEILNKELLRIVGLFGSDGYFRNRKYLVVLKQYKIVTIIK